ncbi:hypothetical protein GBA52_013659 [Prunus armeniaca]|nr:hypothetical protein GBA52_013659 [Prunus armeniaca]
MGSKSKPLRLEKKPKRQDSVKDRISELPDAILCHILSFIPTKYAVRTSFCLQDGRGYVLLFPF